MEFTAADGGVAALVAVSAWLAASRGLLREVMSIAGWVVAILGGLYAAPWVDPLLREAPMIGGFLSSSCSLSKVASFVVSFAGLWLLVSLFTPLLGSALEGSRLSTVDRALGILFGAARGLILAAVLYLIYVQVVPPADRLELIETAASAALISDTADALVEAMPSTLPDWLVAPVNTLMAECGGVPLLSGEAGLQAPAGEGAEAPAAEAPAQQ